MSFSLALVSQVDPSEITLGGCGPVGQDKSGGWLHFVTETAWLWQRADGMINLGGVCVSSSM